MGRALGLVGRLATTAVALATFAGASVAAVSLHAGTPAFRRTAAKIANDAVAELFAGKLVIRDVEVLSLGRRGRVRARSVEVIDPDGRTVIAAKNVEAAIDVSALLSSLSKGSGAEVDVSETRIGDAEVVLDLDAEGKLLIAKAFELRPKDAATETTAATKTDASRPPRVRIGETAIGHAHVHGNPGSPIDGEASEVRARFELQHATSRVFVDDGAVTLRTPAAPNQRAPLVGAVHGTLEVTRRRLRGEAELRGSYGSVPVAAHARIDGDDVDATVDVARTTPEALATAWSDLPFQAPLAVHAHGHGTLPVVDLEARAALGDASVMTATGTIDVTKEHPFTLDVDASHVDARALGGGITTDLGGKAHAEGTFAASGLPTGTFHVTKLAGTVADQPLPESVVDGRLESGVVTATIAAREPGLDASGKVGFDLATHVGTFDVRARSNALRAVTRIPTPLDGSASVRAQGSIDASTKTIHGTVDASAESLAQGAFSATQVEAHGVLGGALSAPLLDVTFASGDVRLQAEEKKPLVYPKASGRATLAFAPRPQVLNASVELGGHGVAASARSVSVENGKVEASGLKITGMGEPLELDVSGEGSSWSIRAKSDRLDLHRAARVTGISELELLPPGTRASVDIDVQPGPGGPRGHVDVVVRGEDAGAGDLVAEAHATIDRGRLVGTAKVAKDGFGQLEIANAELVLPARMDARSLAETTGSLELRGAVDLGQGAALFAGERVERVSGIASFEARIDRGDPKALPAVRGTVRTTGLEVVLGADGAGQGQASSITVGGVDLLTHLAWDGRTDDAEVAVISWDEHGLLGTAAAKARVPLDSWIRGAKIDRSALALLDVGVAADVPKRDLAELPSFLRLLGLRGAVEGQLRVAGTVGHPEIVVSARADGLAPVRPLDRSSSALEPVDGTLEARWNGSHAAVTFALDERPKERSPGRGRERDRGDASSHKTREPGYVHGLVLGELDAKDLLRGGGRPAIPWKASAEVEVHDVTLAALPIPGRMTGVVSGRARLSDLNSAPSFEGKLHVDGFGANGAEVDGVDVTLGGRDASLFAQVSASDPATSGKATFQIASQALRVQGVDPSWDSRAATRIEYSVQNGRLALAAPIFRRTLSELDGVVNGAGSVTLQGDSQVFEGGLAVQDGSVYVNSVGEEITSLGAIAQFDRSGAWKIDKASGKTGTGEFVATASGRLQGLHFVDAQARIVASKGGIPISSEAATFASAVGEVTISAKSSDDGSRLVATVDIPRATFSLPDRSPQKLEPLTADPTVAIGVRRKNGELDTSAVRRSRRSGRAAGASDASQTAVSTRITVTLGKNVRLEGRGMDVSLSGQTLVDIAQELKVTGRIDLRSGSIEVHGRRFTVDRGTVSFLEGQDPANPTVIAAAYWDSPDNTKVWVEFAGPIKTGKLTLRSEPPLSKNEILSVLLFGQPDPNMAASGATDDKSGDGGATAIGTGLVADDLNRVLSDIDENLDVETDTLEGNRARTKLGRSFFDRRLKVQIGYAPGQSYREPDTKYLFLNWQFIPKWSLVTTLGDRGTSILDVLFQHRY
jgi:translocation and assembly module TamB